MDGWMSKGVSECWASLSSSVHPSSVKSPFLSFHYQREGGTGEREVHTRLDFPPPLSSFSRVFSLHFSTWCGHASGGGGGGVAHSSSSPVGGVVKAKVVPGGELTPRIYLHVVHILGLGVLDHVTPGPEGDDDVVLAVVVVPELAAVGVVADAELDLVRLRGAGQGQAEGERVVDVVGGGHGQGRYKAGLHVLVRGPVGGGVPDMDYFVER